MNIVIIGAGEVGLHLASLLSNTDYNITLIDKDPRKLNDAAQQLDIATEHGSGTDWALLKKVIEVNSPSNILIAATDDDETNLVCCTAAKHIGYTKTIARIRQNSYFKNTEIDWNRTFQVDHIFSPEQLVAYELFQSVLSPASTSVASFSDGAIQMRTFIIPKAWDRAHIPLHSLALPKGVVIALIHRRKGNKQTNEYEMIFPHGSDYILAEDEVTFIGQQKAVLAIHNFFHIEQKKVNSAVVMGGSLIGSQLARYLVEANIHVKLIDKDYKKCCEIAHELPSVTVLHHDGRNQEIFMSERLDMSDILIASTKNDDTNILTGMIAKESGIKNVLVLLSNTQYQPLLKKWGLNHTVSPLYCAANYILPLLQTKSILSIASLYNNSAEIIELSITDNAKVANIPLSLLGPRLPPNLLIAIIEHNNERKVANGNSILQSGDSVVLITDPKYFPYIQANF
ncbi:MAG: trkA [Chlamydiales bacterium]|jgi:trk system potassium uptake protein TrkA|nr:trkA [Chlamydiales bacterium]